MNLSEMTREQLWALDRVTLIKLAKYYDIDTTTMVYDAKKLCSIIIKRPSSYILSDLDQRRIELQKER